MEIDAANADVIKKYNLDDYDEDGDGRCSLWMVLSFLVSDRG